jgi:hypothetical protein
MGKSATKQTIDYVQKAIQDCWESQGLLDPEDPEFKELDQQLIAYQDVHVHLTGEEFAGDDVQDDETPTEEEEPDKVLEENDDNDAEDEEDEDAESDEQS